VDTPNAHLEANQARGTTYGVDWVDIEDPAPTFPFTPGSPAPTTNDAAAKYVGDQGRALGAAGFSRLEGMSFMKGEIWFTSTQGGGAPEGASDTSAGYGNGTGQVWSYDPKRATLTCRYQSQSATALELPDNITSRNDRGSILICEDGPADNYVRRLDKKGRLSDVVLNRLRRNATDVPRFGEEFAGATFSPSGDTLFVNIQATQGVSFAIWGPWGRLGI
jgi:hypothetical protein